MGGGKEVGMWIGIFQKSNKIFKRKNKQNIAVIDEENK